MSNIGIRSVITITTAIVLMAGCSSDEFTGSTAGIQGFWKVTALSERPPVPDYVLIEEDEEGYDFHYQGSNPDNSRNCYLREEGYFRDREEEVDVYEGFNIVFLAEKNGSSILIKNVTDSYYEQSNYGDLLLEQVEGLSVQDLSICTE